MDLEFFLLVSSNLFNTYLATTVFPLPVFPYNKRLEGLDSWRIGERIWPIDVICSSLYGRFSGIKSVLKACLFVNSIEPDRALLKMESNGLGCFCMYLTWYVELSTCQVATY